MMWWEAHRPFVLDDFVGQEHVVDVARAIINGAPMQNMLFYSPGPGTGKTTLARILAQELGYTLHVFNASSKRTRGIEFIEEDVLPLSRNGLRETIILLDEADRLTIQAQDALKGVIEGSDCAFILTCNDLSLVRPWVQSRCNVYTFKGHAQEDIVNTLEAIAQKEGVPATRLELQSIAVAHKGDMRNAIGALQAFSCLENDDERRRFLDRIRPTFNVRAFLRMAATEKAVVEAAQMLDTRNMRAIVRDVFDYATTSKASPDLILRVVESCVISERDLVNGVDEAIVRWDFCRMLAS